MGRLPMDSRSYHPESPKQEKDKDRDLAAPPSPRHESNVGQALRRQKDVPTEENTTIQNETSTAGATRIFKCLA